MNTTEIVGAFIGIVGGIALIIAFPFLIIFPLVGWGIGLFIARKH